MDEEEIRELIREALKPIYRQLDKLVTLISLEADYSASERQQLSREIADAKRAVDEARHAIEGATQARQPLLHGEPKGR